MILQDVIEALSKLPQDALARPGLTFPHSYRGYYDQLAFSLCPEARIADMLKMAKDCVGCVFEGYKGGDFRMDQDTPCWIAEHGNSGVELAPKFFENMMLSTTNRFAPAVTPPQVNDSERLKQALEALRECAKHVGAEVGEGCSFEFHMFIPQEVRLAVEALKRKIK